MADDSSGDQELTRDLGFLEAYTITEGIIERLSR